MKHLKHMFATYLYCHCKICNIPDLFCNIQIKRLKHLSKTFETLKTWRCWRPQPTWWGTSIASNSGQGGRREQWPSVHPSIGIPAATSSWWRRGGGGGGSGGGAMNFIAVIDKVRLGHGAGLGWAWHGMGRSGGWLWR
jgi:hypothetical protein